ncbi:MAG: hypothetical protein ACJ790_01160, partial [Myxococcaceae bacterium]
MEEFFSSLTKRQQMLLLTGVTFGGQDSIGAFDHLGEAESETLKHRASKLLEIPRDKRIPLLVQEIKRLVTSRKTYLWNAEPEAFARLLTKERPALREIILRALPMALAEAVRQFLPPSAAVPDKELKPGVLAVVRWKLEQLLEQASVGAMWKFSDLLLLKPRELYTLAERQGVRALGVAFAALPEESRYGAFEQLPPDLRAMAQRATDAAGGRALGGTDAHALLQMHGWDKSPLEAIRSAGIQRLARACMAQSEDFAARMSERHRPPFLPIFQKWLADDRTRGAARGDGGRAEIVAELERLETRGLVDKPTRLPSLKQKPVLPPPPSAPRQDRGAAQQQQQQQQPAGKVPTPAGGQRQPPPSQRMPSQVIAPKAPQLDSPRRDPIAEREARRAGAASSNQMPSVHRDPIAERNARRAGAASSRFGSVSPEDAAAPIEARASGRNPSPVAEGQRGSSRMPAAAPPSPDPQRGSSRAPSVPPPLPNDQRAAPKQPAPAKPEQPRRSSHAVLSPLPKGAKSHPGGIAREHLDSTDPVRSRPPPLPKDEDSASAPRPDPGGSRIHRS